jgi:hypothetical protein
VLGSPPPTDHIASLPRDSAQKPAFLADTLFRTAGGYPPLPGRIGAADGEAAIILLEIGKVNPLGSITWRIAGQHVSDKHEILGGAANWQIDRAGLAGVAWRQGVHIEGVRNEKSRLLFARLT